MEVIQHPEWVHIWYFGVTTLLPVQPPKVDPFIFDRVMYLFKVRLHKVAVGTVERDWLVSAELTAQLTCFFSGSLPSALHMFSYGFSNARIPSAGWVFSVVFKFRSCSFCRNATWSGNLFSSHVYPVHGAPYSAGISVKCQSMSNTLTLMGIPSSWKRSMSARYSSAVYGSCVSGIRMKAYNSGTTSFRKSTWAKWAVFQRARSTLRWLLDSRIHMRRGTHRYDMGHAKRPSYHR